MTAGASGEQPGPGGPLQGCTVIELAGAGPVPFAATVLADLGARVVRIDRPGRPVALYPRDPEHDVLGRGRESIVLDLKAGGAEVALRLVERADAFVEGLRPGVVERLGLGPAACQDRNRQLTYGRVSGWGRSGPLAAMAGHDINFIAAGGVLAQVVGRDGTPAIPLSLVGDFGGAGMSLALGVVAGILEARSTGRGRVIDTSILDAVASVVSPMWGLLAEGEFVDDAPGTNVGDGGAPFYNVYRCADGRYLAVGAIEEVFRQRLATLLDHPAVLGRAGREGWARERDELEAVFATRTSSEWCELFADEDVCVSPVLTLSESKDHPQMAGRERFVDQGGVVQPRPAWVLDDEPLPVPPAGPAPGRDTEALLAEVGCDEEAVARLRATGALG